MKIVTITRFFAMAIMALLSTALVAQSQGKAKVQIKKSENGSTEEYSEEFELKDGQDIQDILRELNLLDEFGQLKDGQAFEINIRKFEGEEELQKYDIQFYPERKSWMDAKPMLGVMLREANSEEGGDAGAQVTEVIDGTAAQTADLEIGDIIYEINGDAVKSVADLVNLIQALEVGDDVKVNYYREGKKKKANTTLGEWKTEETFFYHSDDFVFPHSEDFDLFVHPETLDIPEFDSRQLEELQELNDNALFWLDESAAMEEGAFLGVSPSCDSGEGEGVQLGCIVEGSSAEEMGLLQGDRVTSFNGAAVNNFDELSDAIGNAQPGDNIKMDVLRGGKKKNVKGNIGKREYSNCDKMKIYHDFKGMDEGGNLFYDYQFNMDEEEMEQMQMEIEALMEGAAQELEERGAELNLLERELNENENNHGMFEETESVSIRIDLQEVSDAEADNMAGLGVSFDNENDLIMESISFYPNPSNGQINLRFSLATEGDVKIMIFDQRGNMIFNESRMNFNGYYANDIDISNQADGAYFLQIVQNTQTYSKKIIKQS